MTDALARTPEPPYTAVIFSSLRTEGDHGYAAMSDAMELLAARQPGYLGIESTREHVGITVSYWATEADAQAWKQVAEHEVAQRRGRDTWYSEYRVRVATVTREYGSPSRPVEASRGVAVEDGHMEGDVVLVHPWAGPWPADDPDANFKSDVALYSRLDPMSTVRNLAELGIPVGALVRYVLAKWASEGSAALMELGPVAVGRLWEPVERAEQAGTDDARLAAYDELRQYVSWLKVPLDNPDVYP